MGLFDFVKNAGAKLFGADDEPKAAEAQAPAADPAEVKRLHDRRAAMRLVQVIEKLGLEVADLSVRVDGEVAIVSGKAASQADREKLVLVVGNTAGIAQVDDQMSVETPEPEAVFYTVVSGDTLGAIAKRHYGNAIKYPVIFEANRPMLEDPDRIYPGQVLRIPALDD